ncbi:MAG: permease [Caulobacteraceae bacterium]|nr:permease [Caulobacteraceae bacterium]
MTGALTIWSLGLLVFCVLAEIGRELNFKAAILAADRDRYVLSLAAQPLLWCGLVLWTAEVAAWLLALTHTRLAIAYPISTLSYAGVPLAAAIMLGEKVSRRQKLGMALVAAGVLCITVSELRWTT